MNPQICEQLARKVVENLFGRKDEKPLLVERGGDQPDEESIIADPPTSKKRFLTEQERAELCEVLGIPKGGYRRREWKIAEELQKQTGDESLRVIELFEDRIIYESRSGVFQSGYSLIENSVKLLETVRLEKTVGEIKEQLRSDRKKKFFERKIAGLHIGVKPVKVDESALNPQQLLDRKMAGFLPKSELLEQSPVDESSLTERQKKDRRAAGLSWLV